MTTEKQYDLYSQAFSKNSHETYAKIRQEEPVLRQTGFDGQTPVWFITRYQDVDRVLRDDKHFVLDWRLVLDPEELKRYQEQDEGVWVMLNQHLLTLEGEDHKRLRALVSKAFTPRMVAELRPRIQQIADELIDAVEAQGKMDVIESYAFPLPITVIAELLGIPVEDRFKFREWSDAFVTPVMTAEDQAVTNQKMLDFVSYLNELFYQRRETPRNDLITALLQAEEAGEKLSLAELFSMIVLLIVAGHETTVTLLGNATLALLTHPEVKERLQKHPEEMPHAVEEFLRYDSPVDRSITRWAAEDVEIGGKFLRRGDMLICVLGSANRDEAQFDDARRLVVERENKNHMAFGRGVHYCLGAPLARMEAEIALNTLLRRLPNLCLAQPVEALEYRQVPLFHSLKSLPVTWE